MKNDKMMMCTFISILKYLGYVQQIFFEGCKIVLNCFQKNCKTTGEDTMQLSYDVPQHISLHPRVSLKSTSNSIRNHHFALKLRVNELFSRSKEAHRCRMDKRAPLHTNDYRYRRSVSTLVLSRFSR